MDNEAIPRGHIEDMGVLNLLAAKSAEDFAGIASIEDVGVVLVPWSLAMAAARIPMEDVGVLVPVPEGEDVTVITGQTTTTGDALAAGDPQRHLLIVGQVFIETVVTSVGYKGIQVVGQLFAPRGSETALGAALRDVTGQVLYTPPGARFIFDTDSYGREFFEALPQQTPLVVLGTLTLESDVDAALLRRVVPEIVLFGTVIAPRALLPTLQVLTPQKFGSLVAKEG